MQISILITTYNANQYILETLAAIIAQSHKDYEIIIVDDGSTDGTVTTIEQFVSNHAYVDCRVKKSAHIGRAKALQAGVALARFEWIAILDADDLWHPDKLKTQVACIMQHGINFLATRAVNFTKPPQYTFLANAPTLIKINFKQMLFSNLICHSSLMIKKNLLNYNIERLRQIDYEHWLRLMTGTNEHLYVLDLPLTFHRIHSNQSFEAKMRTRYLWSTIKLQLHYALKHKEFGIALLVCLKLGYYMLLPRKIRMSFRALLLNSERLV